MCPSITIKSSLLTFSRREVGEDQTIALYVAWMRKLLRFSRSIWRHRLQRVQSRPLPPPYLEELWSAWTKSISHKEIFPAIDCLSSIAYRMPGNLEGCKTVLTLKPLIPAPVLDHMLFLFDDCTPAANKKQPYS